MMAASVDNRQFRRLETAFNGVFTPLKPGPSAPTHRRVNMFLLIMITMTLPARTKEMNKQLQRYDPQVRNELEPSVLDSRDEATADNWIERNGSMVRCPECVLRSAEFTWRRGSKYGTSIKKEFAIDPSRDIILAYMQNGKLLTPDHGFPIRMIIPGFIGGRMVKWLKRIIVTTQESENYYHYKDNRVLPSHVDAELANEEGGGKKVTRVEVTMDGGETWQVCTLDHTEKPNKYGKFWCWCFWSLEVEVLDLLGAKEIAVRAWDETLNTQPEKLIWNVMGMMNNCWFRVKTNICKQHKGEIGIVFEHPTLPGNQSGGWMAKERHLEKSVDANPTLKKSVSSPFMNTASKTFSMSEVKKHNSADSAWIVVHEFEAIHSDKPRNCWKIIGSVSCSRRDTVPTRPHHRRILPCTICIAIGRSSAGLPVGKHIFLCATIDDKLCMRAYTPTSTIDEVGHFDLVVKVYFKRVHPKFPNGGLMQRKLYGPWQTKVCQKVGNASWRDRDHANLSSHQSHLEDPEDETEMYVVVRQPNRRRYFAERRARWLGKEARSIESVVRGPRISKGRMGIRLGFITENILREHIPEGSNDTLALACGPPPMIQFAVQPNLEKMKYVKDSLLVFLEK
ncbi:Nitrate reductase [Hibiscus syriacus]|uniref:Nitrate reductase n=1 Tax=Hibiscus syriacus TaxID=106335 RepID=A0A6A2W980_HIBSY|nr:Nitrate reductase [Hibiscus syriacus]